MDCPCESLAFATNEMAHAVVTCSYIFIADDCCLYVHHDWLQTEQEETVHRPFLRWVVSSLIIPHPAWSLIIDHLSFVGNSLELLISGCGYITHDTNMQYYVNNIMLLYKGIHMWQSRVEIKRLFRCIFWQHRCVWSAVSLNLYGWGSYVLCRCMNIWWVYVARMSPTPNRSSVIQYFELSYAIEIRDRIIFNFYTGLPHMSTWGHQLQWQLNKVLMPMKRWEEDVTIVINHHKIYDHISSTWQFH